MYTYNFVKDDGIYEMWTYRDRDGRDAAFQNAVAHAKAEDCHLYVNIDEVEL